MKVRIMLNSYHFVFSVFDYLTSGSIQIFMEYPDNCDGKIFTVVWMNVNIHRLKNDIALACYSFDVHPPILIILAKMLPRK